MEISKYSRNRLLEAMNHWSMPRDYADPLYNYFVHGYSPGGFFTSVLANNFVDAISHSHPGNSIQGLKAVVGWLRSSMTFGIMWGSYEVVQKWLAMSDEQRREQLEALNLVYPEQEEIVMILKNEPTIEPIFFG